MKKIVLGIILLLGINNIKAQSDMVELLAVGKLEANHLIGNYASPFLETFGNNLNNGWYTTAAPLKTGRFTLTIGGTASFVPKDKQSFLINPAEYTHIKNLANDNTSITAPTVFGDKTPITDLFAYYDNGNGSILKKRIPLKGTGFNFSPLPVVQMSVGLLKGTEVMIRIIPKLDLGDYKANYFGVGLKHDIKQWIPFMSKLPFDLSFIGAFTNANLDMKGNNFLQVEASINNPMGDIFNNQTISFSSSAWNANLAISKKFSVLTLVGSIRLSHYKTTLDLKGNYPITTLDSDGVKTITNIVDPIGIESSATNIGFNGGLRIKLGFIALFAEGSFVPSGYSSATAGLNIGFFN
ncbi:MAG: hypothetical protein HXX18_11030 [Bacteroidetes bacterium]|nr:hypothetical protein [Bacteroidota bacterium]